jgi:hypothetical protein
MPLALSVFFLRNSTDKNHYRKLLWRALSQGLPISKNQNSYVLASPIISGKSIIFFACLQHYLRIFEKNKSAILCRTSLDTTYMLRASGVISISISIKV